MSPASCFLPPLKNPVRTIGRQTFDLSRSVVVMAIVNRTRDSFFDSGRTFGLDEAVASGLAAARAGAGWVDVGAVPFSPNTVPVSETEELDRVLPVVAALAAASEVVVSVDTFRAEVARQSLEAGASVINDTSGLRDPEIARVVAAHGATLVITHSLARPGEHVRRPAYGDVVADVAEFLLRRVETAVALGVPEESIVLDPGHDLNKNTEHSLELTRRLPELAALGFPLLAAVSNKDFIGESIGLAKDDRRDASLAAATLCIWQGARILRMHDVAGSRAAADMVEVLLGLRPPVRLEHNLS